MAARKPHASSASPRFGRRAFVLTAVAAASLLAGSWAVADWWTCLPEGSQATYVGRQSCIQCHASQAARWEGSDHDRAMDHATEATVLGDFNDARLEHYGVTSRMFRRDGKFMVHTEGPDGRMADFEVKYVFGVRPLQQYMVEFDRPADMPKYETARLQVLRVSWDVEKKKWFYLSPPDVHEKLAPDDDLHWTGVAQRWNNMCADCHSTNLKKNFDPKTKTYHTTWSEIDVSCEACHGPGSLHVQLAGAKSLFWDRKLGYGLPKFKGKEGAEAEIQACAPCHARRRIVHPDFRPGGNYFDHFATETLGEMTYHADGQILDEVYEHGSFLQSKMYHKGIRCSDCHDPHSAKIKFTGNQLCTSCHAHPAGKYDAPSHHRHAAGGKGSQCVDCHMPTTTYMEVDPRRDHSLRPPRPALSVKFGTPNACTGCHLASREPPRVAGQPATDPTLAARPELKEYADWLRVARQGDDAVKQQLAKYDQWAADAVKTWYGEKKEELEHYAAAFHAARTRQSDAESRLAKLAKDRRYPALVRATALVGLAGYDSSESLEAARSALSDPDPQVRAAALSRLDSALAAAMNGAQARQVDPRVELRPLVELLAGRLEDPVRVVRTEAARTLARLPRPLLDDLASGPQRRKLADALDEFRAGLEANNDRAGAHMAKAMLMEDQGELESAVAAYQTAIDVEPRATGPRTNLAALLDRLAQQTEQQVRQLASQRQMERVEQLAALMQRFQKDAARLRREELDLLARDARLAPDNVAVQYRYGLSLYLHDQPAEAEAALKKAAALDPQAPDALMALALLMQKLERFGDARRYAEQLLKLRPQDLSYQQLLQEIRRQEAGANGNGR